MNDLDTRVLREALKAPAEAGGPVDVTRIMTRGRRLRHRRRLAAVGGCLCAAAVLVGVPAAIAHLTAPPPARMAPAGPAQHGPAGYQPPATVRGPQQMPRPAAGEPTASPVPTASLSLPPSPSPSLSPSETPTSVLRTPVGVPAASPTGFGASPAASTPATAATAVASTQSAAASGDASLPVR